MFEKHIGLTLRKKYPYFEFFPHSDLIWRARMRENRDQKNSKYGHFSHCVTLDIKLYFLEHMKNNTTKN